MMRNAKVVLVGVMSLSLAGCVLNGKQKTLAATPTPPQPTVAAPPPEPLSIPQTTVELPAPQPFEREALNTVQPAEPATPAQNKPQAPKTPTPRNNAGGNSAPSGPATLPKAPETQAAPEPAESPAREPLREILPDEERNRLKDSVHMNQAEARKVVSTANPKNSNQTTDESRDPAIPRSIPAG